MNKIILKGNLTKDVEMQTTANGINVAKFTIAVQRKFANADGERETDFINCVAWRNTAEFINKYFNKGSQILVCGSIQTRSYDAQDGTKRYVTEAIIDEAYFCGSKQDGGNADEKKEDLIPIDNLTDLPF